MTARTRLVVVFGGASPEHDVNVVTAQQVMEAADARRFDIIPVHLGFDNRFRTGPALRDPARFRPVPAGLEEAHFAWGEAGPELRLAGGGAIRFDCALPACHGAYGEDGRIQAMFEVLGIPVTGFSATHSAVAMRKDLTKTVARAAGVPVLDHVLVRRGEEDYHDRYLSAVRAGFGLPAVVKPASLGSSIGVGLARTEDELVHLVTGLGRRDIVTMIEPQVRNLTEYNIAVMRRDGEICFSAIERPRSSEELLDFREKYLSGGGGAKGTYRPSEGMLSLTRDIEPDMPAGLRAALRAHAGTVFRELGARGAPRLDFMVDGKTGQLWFNEINPIPGSYGFFLWEAAPDGPLLFSELIDHLVDEALSDTVKTFDDPVPQDAWLLPR